MSEEGLGPILVKLGAAIDDDDTDVILALSDEGLAILPHDSDLLRCKVNAMIELSQFTELLAFLTSDPSFLPVFGFEYAYCLFVSGSHAESHAYVVANRAVLLEENPIGLQHLEAQLHFVLGSYLDSVSLYEQLIEEGETDLETYTNFSACLVLSQQSDRCVTEVTTRLAAPDEDEEEGETEEPFQLYYNLSCAHTDLLAIDNARSVLEQSSRVCRHSLEDQQVDEERILVRLTPCNVLEAYIAQLCGDIDLAENLYVDLIRRKPQGHTVALAVANNNLVTLHARRRGSASVFEAERRMRLAMEDRVQGKLTKWQRRAVHLNKVLLLLQMKQFDEARALFEDLERNYPETDIPTLIRASLAYRKKDFDTAVESLQNSPSPTPTIEMSLAQLFINRGDVASAVGILENCSIRHRPSIVGCLVGIFRKENRIEDCLRIFAESVTYWKQCLAEEVNQDVVGRNRKEEIERTLVSLLREQADFLFSIAQHDEAVSTYEDMRRIDPSNLKFAAGLVISLAGRDIAKAEQHLQELPAIDLGKWNLASLERLNIHIVRSRKKVVDSPSSPGPADGSSRRRRKRKNPTPKTFDPNATPDPERWIPKWERRANREKRRRQKRRQGATVDEGLDHQKRTNRSKKSIEAIIRQSQGGKKKKGGGRRRKQGGGRRRKGRRG